MSSNQNNPFVGLFSDSDETNRPTENNANSLPLSPTLTQKAAENLRINAVVEDIFNITLNKNANVSKKNQLIFLEDLATSLSPQDWIDLETLEQALFERIILPEPSDYLLPRKVDSIDIDVCQKEVLIYLFDSYNKLKTHKVRDPIVNTKMKELIMRNVVTSLKQPELFDGQDLYDQLLTVVQNVEHSYKNFFCDLVTEYKKDEDDDVSLELILDPLLKKLSSEVRKCDLMNLRMYVFQALDVFTTNEDLASVFLNHIEPKLNTGAAFRNSVIGALLSLSILPEKRHDTYIYFTKPMDAGNEALQSNLWMATNTLTSNLQQIILSLLKRSASIKERTLRWIGKCLQLNTDRGKIGNTFMPMDLNPNVIGDGFFLNLCSLMAKLCSPFCSKLGDKILKVDPTYCAVEDSEISSKCVHMEGVSSMTCLLPLDADDSDNSLKRNSAKTFNFISECFYMTHRTLDLGFRVCYEELIQLNQRMQRIQGAFNDAMNEPNAVPEMMEQIKQRMEKEMATYTSVRVALLEPQMLKDVLDLHAATAMWLTQVCLHFDGNEVQPKDSYAPLNFISVEFPLPDAVPDTLRCIPEFIIENIVGFLSFLRRFTPVTIEEHGYEKLAPILTMILTFMGSPNRMKNPHLRARLAECLESLLPKSNDQEPSNFAKVGYFQREKLFLQHPHRDQIVRCVLNVFVSIEMTGQSVQFEQKFNYRRPMYVIMDYLWDIEEHKQNLKDLAAEAEADMEAIQPPLFLRFINLLMNDAVFLLDEALTNMAQLRTMEIARDNDEWSQLPSSERQNNLAEMQHIGMMARFDNILGRDTIHTLKMLTSTTPTVFTHSTMADRIAAMLNYFLLNLVGPNKKNFKVKNPKDYEFSPADTVLDICSIYVALGQNDTFCLAISQDGRSYSPQLFSLAENVLARIGGGTMISDLREVSNHVSELASKQQADDEILSEAPDDFLDPIMSTLMLDPVILPSSKQTVDRTTIARHLLSDQTDPFNRSPLTMDQVIPNRELYKKIHDWIAEKRNGAK